ncbi:MAG: hypothetical protein ABSC08_14570 [Bryobacteraceae bacterium]
MPIYAFYRIDANLIEAVKHYAETVLKYVPVAEVSGVLLGLGLNIKHRRDDANRRRSQELTDELLRWFYPHRVNGPASIVQPARHPNTPPSQTVSKSGLEVWNAYLPFAKGVRRLADSLQVPASDGMVLVASPAGSVEAQDYTSNGAHQRQPEFTITNPAGQWQTQLTWAFYTPARLTGEEYPYVLHDTRECDTDPHAFQEWESAPHAFQHVEERVPIESKPEPLQPAMARGALTSIDITHALHIYTHDYLLITSLPRYADISDPGRREQRVINFAGLHRPGTRAAALLFNEPSTAIFNALTQQTGNKPCYQALFKVRVRNEDGEAVPTALELLKATPLSVYSAGGSLVC